LLKRRFTKEAKKQRNREIKKKLEMQESKKKNLVKTYYDLNVYQLSYKLAMEIFELTKKFPKEEIYSLTNQIRRSSRSVPANIGEGWAKRRYENVFLKYLQDANGSCEETKIWLDFAKDCQYINSKIYDELKGGYNQTGAMLNSLINNWQTF
jgi:four helix bundle protein